MVRLDPDEATVQRCFALLSPDEAVRARRFLLPTHQRRYAVARASLRALLGAELGLAPEAVRFRYGEHGKPALAPGPAGPDLGFNVSHSGELALIGLIRGAQIGVDIEAERDLTDQDALVRRYFSAAEIEDYFGLEPARRRAAFFNGWTRKEALVKALGQGLAFPLRAFDVTLAPGEAAALLRVQQIPGEHSGWCLAALEVAPGIAAAVATQGSVCRVVARQGPGALQAGLQLAALEP